MGEEQLHKTVYKICPAYSHCRNDCCVCPFGNITSNRCLHATQPESFSKVYYHVVAVELTKIWLDFFQRNLGVVTFFTEKEAFEYLEANYAGRYIL